MINSSTTTIRILEIVNDCEIWYAKVFHQYPNQRVLVGCTSSPTDAINYINDPDGLVRDISDLVLVGDLPISSKNYGQKIESYAVVDIEIVTVYHTVSRVNGRVRTGKSA